MLKGAPGTGEDVEREKAHRIRCRRLYELSKHENFPELLNFLEDEINMMFGARAPEGLDGAIGYLSAKVWQDALVTFRSGIKDKVLAGKQMSGDDDESTPPGDQENEEEYRRSERRRA